MAYSDKLENNESLANYDEYYKWFDVDRARLIKLLQNHKDKLAAKMGKWNGTFRSEFLHYIWEYVVDGVTFFVFTGKKGTSFEVSWSEYTDSEVRAAIPKLLDQIYNLVK